MRLSAILFPLLLFSAFALAVNLPARPTSYVSDFANILQPQERAYLETLCTELEHNTTAELAIVTVSSLEGMEISQYSIELADAWKVGKKDKDNGVIILLAPNEREVRIEVGYGLEGALPDVRASRIIREQMAPFFKDNQWFDGLKAGAEAIAVIVRAEAPEGTAPPSEMDSEGLLIFTIFWLVLCTLFFVILYSVTAKLQPAFKWRNTLKYTYAGAAVLALAFAFLGSFVAIFFALAAFFHIFALASAFPKQPGKFGGGGFIGGGRFGGGGFSSGGGFGGFGGGSFGGGGASGRF